MNGLERRIERLESSNGKGVGTKDFIIAVPCVEGGVVTRQTMRWHPNDDDLLKALGLISGDCFIFHFPRLDDDGTAEEILERFRQPEPELTQAEINALGEQAKESIASGCSPYFAKLLEEVNGW
jgi:hypothetical protein